MSEFDGGAPAPAESNAVPVATESAPQTQPLGSQTPVAEKPPTPAEAPKAEAKPEPSKSPGEAISKALAAVKERQAADKAKAEAPKPEAKPSEPEKAAQPRSEGGQFASPTPQEKPAAVQQPAAAPVQREPSAHSTAPARFSNDAKTAWEATAEPVRAEIHRAIRELEQGHQKYKADSEAFEAIREFDALAKQHNTDLKTALTRYTNMERLLASDPIRGFQELANNMRLPLREIAAAIVGQAPEEVQSQQDSTIRQLQAQVQQLTQQLGGVTQTFQQQRQSETLSKIESFAKDNPRFEELAPDIEFFLTSGRTKDLSEAYALAERLNPAAAPAPAPAPVIPAAPKPLNPAGQKSISGSPAAGSDPATKRQPASDNREALDRAFARIGA